MRRIALGALMALFGIVGAAFAAPDRQAFLDLARKGWVYELRTTMIGRDLSIPVRISGKALAGAPICIVGERPTQKSWRVINAFRALMRETSGKTLPVRFAGPTARLCGVGRTVVLRLYSGRPPARALTDDLYWLNEVYALGLPANRQYAANSPAMAQTFFGRRGQATHLMVKQADRDDVTPTEEAFYRSILIEELFQSFSFGMDILHFDRSAAFLSKLEEFPTDLRRVPWESPIFMERLLRSNPRGLCEFDIFMLYAVAEAPFDETNDPAFIDFIDSQFDALMTEAAATSLDPAFAEIVDPGCTVDLD